MKPTTPHDDTTAKDTKHCTWKYSWTHSLIRITLAVLLIVSAFIAGTRFSGGWDKDGKRGYEISGKHSMMMDRSDTDGRGRVSEAVIQRKQVEVSHDPMQMSMSDMGQMLRGKTGDELNRAFLEMMIPHHQAAVEMAQALATSDKPELVQLGADIITAQTAEIEQMQKWLIEWGYDTESTVPMMDNSGMMMNQVY